MKKFLMIAVMAVAALTASAQQGEYFVTPHIGVGYGNLSNNGNLAGSNYTNAQIGADIEYMVGENFGISGGVDFLYAKSGEYIYQDNVNNYKSNAYVTYAFVNIPVLAQYHFGKFAVKAGVQPGFNVQSKYHEKEKLSSSTTTKDINLSEMCKKFALSVPVGVSYEFNIPIVLDLRCAIPVTKMYKSEYVDKNSSFLTVMLTAGYRF